MILRSFSFLLRAISRQHRWGFTVWAFAFSFPGGNHPSDYGIFACARGRRSIKFYTTEIRTAPPPWQSVPVFGVLILAPGFLTVTPVAERLPVVVVPEQLRIPTMRNLVIDHGRLHIPAVLQAVLTERMNGQESLPCLLPLRVISALCCRLPVIVRMQCRMFIAVFLSMRYEPRASRLSAGMFRKSRQ